MTRLLLLQGAIAQKCSGAHPSFEQPPLTSSRLWTDSTFLAADSPVRRTDHHHAGGGGPTCTSAITDCGAAERASSHQASHDSLLLDEALLFGDDLHHDDPFLTEGTEPDAQVPGALGNVLPGLDERFSV